MATATEPIREAAPPRVRPGRCDCCGAPLRTIQRDRRFSLLDGMILIAASALAFMIVRPLIAGQSRLLLLGADWARYLAMLVACLVTWTPTVLFLKLRAPRPIRLRLSRQPDFVAGLAATSLIALGLFVVGVLAIIRVSRRGALANARLPVRPPDPYWWLNVVIHFGALIGPAVIAAWVVLVVSGRHRPSRGWLDILGRSLGAAWIVVFVIGSCARLGFLRD